MVKAKKRSADQPRKCRALSQNATIPRRRRGQAANGEAKIAEEKPDRVELGPLYKTESSAIGINKGCRSR